MTAAWRLSQQGASVVLAERSGRLGGKIRASLLGGRLVDEGPDSFLLRTSAVTDLLAEVSASFELIHPATSRAYIWSKNRIVPAPTNAVLGVPTSPQALVRVAGISPPGLARAAFDLVRPYLGRRPLGPLDPDLGRLISQRLGREVADRLIDPIIGGIHAGSIYGMSGDTVAPAITEAARRSASLIQGLRQARTAAPGAGPAFASLVGGLSTLVDLMAQALSRRDGVEIRLNSPVHSLAEAGASGDLIATLGSAEGMSVTERFNGILIALGAPEAAPLLAELAPSLADGLARLAHASVTLVTVEFERQPGSDFPGSGFLVPRVDGRLMTACTALDVKWPTLARPDRSTFRLSAGRHGDDRVTEMSDEAVVEALLEELREAVGIRGDPVEVRVTRWPRSFLQPVPGHHHRVSALLAVAAGHPRISFAGQWTTGVGIPAAIERAGAAAHQLLSQLELTTTEPS
jgi:oxygen-dependent protoporphyrinogen oxidase